LSLWNLLCSSKVQQFRAVVPGDQPQRFFIHDRDSVSSSAIDAAVAAIDLTGLKMPVRCVRTRTRSASD